MSDIFAPTAVTSPFSELRLFAVNSVALWIDSTLIRLYCSVECCPGFPNSSTRVTTMQTHSQAVAESSTHHPLRSGNVSYRSFKFCLFPNHLLEGGIYICYRRPSVVTAAKLNSAQGSGKWCDELTEPSTVFSSKFTFHLFSCTNHSSLSAHTYPSPSLLCSWYLPFW